MQLQEGMKQLLGKYEMMIHTCTGKLAVNQYLHWVLPDSVFHFLH